MGSQKMRALRKRMADRQKTWNAHLGGMVFPFPTQWAAQDFVDTVLTEHPGTEYTMFGGLYGLVLVHMGGRMVAWK